MFARFCAPTTVSTEEVSATAKKDGKAPNATSRSTTATATVQDMEGVFRGLALAIPDGQDQPAILVTDTILLWLLTQILTENHETQH